ncbi:type II secretion system protein [Sulfurimonas sp. C5]|uniref:type II secretion system protein n=1 Tax=Sulfurimonas sp. C5 TaxID=3036947 RepID=UPI002456E6A2|nr:type II secretion system protein [Sulfurimonas sp. C5]MDH4944367.1 type II secretion system protein [Sulfurimonas sp. C5]
MKRSAFSLIELIFVIIIMGILSAVVLPKMVGIQEAASNKVVESFVNTVNRSAFPGMYASTPYGSIKNLSLLKYVTIPVQITSIDLTGCGTGVFAPVGQTTVGKTIYCRDGNATYPPLLSFSSTDLNTSLK